MDFMMTSIPMFFFFVFILVAIKREDVQDKRESRIYPEFIQMWWRNKGLCSVTWYLSKDSVIEAVSKREFQSKKLNTGNMIRTHSYLS